MLGKQGRIFVNEECLKIQCLQVFSVVILIMMTSHLLYFSVRGSLSLCSYVFHSFNSLCFSHFFVLGFTWPYCSLCFYDILSISLYCVSVYVPCVCECVSVCVSLLVYVFHVNVATLEERISRAKIIMALLVLV